MVEIGYKQNNMPKICKLQIGGTYGQLTLLEKLPGRKCICSCTCGSIKEIYKSTLHSKKNISCGCYKSKRMRLRNTTHGFSYNLAHASWRKMIRRCGNPKDKSYKNYGGRGITVCDRWQTFENFYADMGGRVLWHSIERIDVDVGYSPNNCKWVPINEQSKNRTNTIRIEGMCLKEYCRLNKLSYERCHQIYRKTGNLELALKGRRKR